MISNKIYLLLAFFDTGSHLTTISHFKAYATTLNDDSPRKLVLSKTGGKKFSSIEEYANLIDDGGNKTTTQCYFQKTCSECAANTNNKCHWCAHDNACHLIGSSHGCITAVSNCSAADNKQTDNNGKSPSSRCHRSTPEPLPSRLHVFKNIIPLPVCNVAAVSILIIAILIFSWIRFCSSRVAKDTYDALQNSISNGDDQFISNGDNNNLSTPLLSSVPDSQSIPVVLAPPMSVIQPLRHSISVRGESSAGREHNCNTIRNPDHIEDPSNDVTQILSETEEGISCLDNNECTNLTEASGSGLLHSTTEQITPTSVGNFMSCSKRQHSCSPHRQRLHRWLTFAVLLMPMVVTTICYYPRGTKFNICNNSMSWHALIDSLSSKKVAIDFQILLSISNPNYLSINLDMFKGTFKHDDVEVGTFEMLPGTVIVSNAITDVVANARFAPDAFEALRIVSEYYQGKLILNIDESAKIRIPALLNLTFPVKFHNLEVDIHNLDRSLCECQK